MDLTTPLAGFGLADKEIKIYIELLSRGTVNLQAIAGHLPFPRTTVYNVLNYLIERGIVAKTVREGITYYTAAQPDKLITILEQKKKLLESVLPELRQLGEFTKESSKVELYEGFKGVFTIISDVFSKRQQTYYFGAYYKSLEILKHLPSQARMMRLENKIPAKIVIETAEEDIFGTKKYQNLTEMRFLDTLKAFPAMIFIYGNKVAMFTLQGDLVGIIVSNKEFSLAMKMIFDLYWNQAKPAKLKIR